MAFENKKKTRECIGKACRESRKSFDILSRESKTVVAVNTGCYSKKKTSLNVLRGWKQQQFKNAQYFCVTLLKYIELTQKFKKFHLDIIKQFFLWKQKLDYQIYANWLRIFDARNRQFNQIKSYSSPLSRAKNWMTVKRTVKSATTYSTIENNVM